MENQKAIDVIKRMFKGDSTAEQLEALELAYIALSNYESDVFEPEYLGENRAIGCRIGRCKCGNIVRSYHNFCNDCGIKLEWGNVWPESIEV